MHACRWIKVRIHFWPLLIGGLILIFGLVGIANEVGGLSIDVPWISIIVILTGIWVLSKAFERR